MSELPQLAGNGASAPGETTDCGVLRTCAEFAVVMPAWNEASFIEESVRAALAAIAQQRYRGWLVVVDNNSTDDTASLASSAGAHVVFEPINQISRARNTGAAATTADWLVFVDADTLINAELLSLTLDALASDDVIGGGSTIMPDRPTGRVGDAVVVLWNWVSTRFATAAGCFFYCRRDAFDTVGGFNTRVYAAEEIHLSRKLRKLAKKTGQRFVIQSASPVITSARKFDWYTIPQIARQLLLLLIPFATHSRRMCGIWYDRSQVNKD